MSQTPDEIKAMNKEVKRLKRIATEWAGQMHDLAEERLPAGFEEIHDIAQSTYDACKAWQEAESRLQAVQAEEVVTS